MLGVTINALLRRGDKLFTRKTDEGATIQTRFDGSTLNLIMCDAHAESLRDDLLALYPVTPSGRRPRRDRKTYKELLQAALDQPQTQRVLHLLRTHRRGEWQTTRAIAMCLPDMTEAVVRAKLHILKNARKVESRVGDVPSKGPRNFTEWRVK